MPRHKADLLESEDSARGISLRVPCLTAIDEAQVRDHLAKDDYFWLDLLAPSEADVERLGELFGFHPLAVEDTIHSGQRPKLDDFGDYVFMVFYAADEQTPAAGARAAGQQTPGSGERLREVHMFISGKYLITIHRDPLPALQQQQSQIQARFMHSEQFVVYRVLDALTDTFFPPLAAIDDEVDALEDAIVADPDDAQLQRVFALKRELVAMRKVVTPQRDLLARGIDTISEIPGFRLDDRDYFRDVYDHLIRISDLVDSYRDLLSGAMDAYLSTVANRQNEVMKQLTIIATIFLPLTFLTGFFGMNFAFLIDHAENTLLGFLLLGIGSCLASVVALSVYFRRKRWT